MNIISGIEKKIGKWLKLGKRITTIIYVGNGADRIHKEKVQEKEFQVQAPGTGVWRFVVQQKISGKIEKTELEEIFSYDKGEFLGYYARKKQGKRWKWYTENGQWYCSTKLAKADAPKKKMFQAGERIGKAFKAGENVYFIAQWRNPENGEVMQTGYPIFSHKLMAHALGAHKGKRYTNTREAFEHSYAEGYRYFEVDVALTTEDALVLSHGWSKKACKMTGMKYKPEFEHMTREQFKKQTISGMHVMDLSDLREIMKQYPDTYFEIDFHRTDVAKKVKVLLKEFEGWEELLDRLLIQAENRKIFAEIDEVYHFLNVQLILGEEWLRKLEEGISFTFEHGIETIAMQQMFFDENAVRVLKEAGLNVMAYTLKDDVLRAKELLAMGVNTICTDFVRPKDILESELDN